VFSSALIQAFVARRRSGFSAEGLLLAGIVWISDFG
jgi:hypothetical protein